MSSVVIMKIWQLKNLTDCSGEKRTLKFVAEFQVMMDNNPNKSIRYSQRHESVQISYQAASAWRLLYRGKEEKHNEIKS